jgi:hypothetical protein
MSEKNLGTSQNNRLSLDRELKQGLQEYEGILFCCLRFFQANTEFLPGIVHDHFIANLTRSYK